MAAPLGSHFEMFKCHIFKTAEVIFMKLVAKCSVPQDLSFKVYNDFCEHFPLRAEINYKLFLNFWFHNCMI